jgi:hypothetical protein
MPGNGPLRCWGVAHQDNLPTALLWHVRIGRVGMIPPVFSCLAIINDGEVLEVNSKRDGNVAAKRYIRSFLGVAS